MTVADICSSEQMVLGTDLTTQLDEAVREATLCTWLESEVVSSCAAKKVMLEQLYNDNENSLTDAQASSETLLQNLFLLSSSSNLERFREDMYDAYAQVGRSLSGVETGI